MEVVEATAKGFSHVFTKPIHVFASGDFNQLNEPKVEAVYYLIFKDSKYRLGLIVGISEEIVKSPFSAPFGGFVFINQEVKIHQIDAAVEALEQWACQKKYHGIQVTLPPTLYQVSFIAKQTNAFYRAGFKMKALDLNYSFFTAKFTEEYPAHIWRNARKNLKIALSSDLNFWKCEDEADKARAYEVIRQNRAERGFPLRMTWAQVSETRTVIDADFFICANADKNYIAAAIVFHVTKDIVQVVYWGDLPKYASLKTMNYLSYKVFEY